MKKNSSTNISKERLEKIKKFNKLRKDIRKSGLLDDYFSN